MLTRHTLPVKNADKSHLQHLLQLRAGASEHDGKVGIDRSTTMAFGDGTCQWEINTVYTESTLRYRMLQSPPSPVDAQQQSKCGINAILNGTFVQNVSHNFALKILCECLSGDVQVKRITATYIRA